MTKIAVIKAYNLSEKLYNRNYMEWKRFIYKDLEFAKLYINDEDYILCFHWQTHFGLNDIPKGVIAEADWKQCISTCFCYGRLMPSKVLAKKDIVRQSKYPKYNGKVKVAFGKKDRGGVIQVSVDASTHRTAEHEEAIIARWLRG